MVKFDIAFVLIGLITAVGVLLVSRLFRKHAASKGLTGAWICLAIGALFLLIYALDGEFSLINVAIALTISLAGLIALIGATVKHSN